MEKNDNSRKRPAYHHGNLRRRLIDVAMEMVARDGPDAVNLREAARRARVSPAAPFRHFASHAELMTAVAAEALHRFGAEIESASAGAANPAERIRAIGVAYLCWAFNNPFFFEAISTRRIYDLDASRELTAANRAIQDRLDAAIAEGVDNGVVAASDAPQIRLAGRALVYGLARMRIDGQLSRWGVHETVALERAIATLDDFLVRYLRPAPPSIPRPSRSAARRRVAGPRGN